MTTRRKGRDILRSDRPAGGPGNALGAFSPRSGSPSPGFFVADISGRGQICLACSRRILGDGVRITYATMTTHAHHGCQRPALKLLA